MTLVLQQAVVRTAKPEIHVVAVSSNPHFCLVSVYHYANPTFHKFIGANRRSTQDAATPTVISNTAEKSTQPPTVIPHSLLAAVSTRTLGSTNFGVEGYKKRALELAIVTHTERTFVVYTCETTMVLLTPFNSAYFVASTLNIARLPAGLQGVASVGSSLREGHWCKYGSLSPCKRAVRPELHRKTHALSLSPTDRDACVERRGLDKTERGILQPQVAGTSFCGDDDCLFPAPPHRVWSNGIVFLSFVSFAIRRYTIHTRSVGINYRERPKDSPDIEGGVLCGFVELAKLVHPIRLRPGPSACALWIKIAWEIIIAQSFNARVLFTPSYTRNHAYASYFVRSKKTDAIHWCEDKDLPKQKC
ncbi:uncharacterized protein EV420DRAFT_1489302 [Desarmillaria tabescens]|uniref:Uncharacterized protein n=1 Tax=Armillaria tabescens TaxID=1929756 RepID=A0AA39J0X2_ARMTA|nr:uncharacterized protein EV420DRAFT_1489302 [Desarmillaria tabescens]KAK0433301.1 hypothetical protein EV420DRAFT_1489302 [Desarmillaria tabescens]